MENGKSEISLNFSFFLASDMVHRIIADRNRSKRPAVVHRVGRISYVFHNRDPGEN